MQIHKKTVVDQYRKCGAVKVGRKTTTRKFKTVDSTIVGRLHAVFAITLEITFGNKKFKYLG